MAHTLAKLLAVVLNSCGVFLFRNTQGFIPCYGAPWLASVIFSFSVYFFVKDNSYFPMSFSKIPVRYLFALEFFFTMFIVEWAVLDFWYSLQYAIMRGLLKIPELLVSESELLQFLVYVLSSKFVVMSVNYVLSAFFLICALHGTRSVDFQLLRLGPCELQDPLWAKMSAVAAGATKKRKKSDTKPQAQINKCNNEKRRREQENIYIEELAELISANFGDMSSLSVKPDKCAILQETVNQIRNIKAREEAAAGVQQGADAVQQGEVSSSRPTILANEVIAPLLLEALDGFLFVVNAEGKVEFVTDNVVSYIKFTREEVLGKSVYNIIHHGDHARFSSNLLPMSISWGNTSGGSSSSGAGSGSGDASGTGNNNGTGGGSRSRSFYCRLMIKPDDQDETMEEKQTRVQQYEQMHISSTQVPYSHTGGASGGGLGGLGEPEDGTGDAGPCLMCLARRVPQCEKAAGSPIEQFTTKLDTTGKIVGIDTSGVSSLYSQYLNKDLMGRIIQELCPQQELAKLATHLKDTLTTGQATSEIYRLRVTTPDKYIRVQTKSKLFKNNPPDQDFIMATHSIIGEHEAATMDLDGGNVGGPLMTSVMNGARNGVPTSRFNTNVSDVASTATSNSLTLSTSTSYTSFPLANADLDFDFFPSSTWDLGPSSWSETTRPDSCQSVTPVSTPTPRPPSAPVYSPAPPAMSSPFNTQPSPSAPNPPTPANNPFNSTFPFSPLPESSYPVDEQKDNKDNVMEEVSAMADSGRLRNLLTKPPTSSSDSTSDPKNRILKCLLNQEDDEENRSEQNRTSPRGLVGGRSNNVVVPGPSDQQPKHANNMLLKLLNQNSDDDDVEQRAGLKKQSELLQQLLKEQDEDRKPAEPQTQDDSLLRSLGFTSSPSPPSASSDHGGPGRARKRPSDERDDLLAKRPNDSSVQVSSSGPSIGSSELCQRNKMLASLLAKQPSHTQPIPPIPASVISATPQEKLPRVPRNSLGMMGQQQNTTVNAQQTADTRQNNKMRMPGRQPATSYLNHMLTPGGDNHNMQGTHAALRQPQSNRGQFTQMDTNTYATAATSSTENSWDIQSSSDPLLSDILDQVIDIVPDADSSAIMHLLDAMESPQNNNFQQVMNEKMAINAIQKSLMLCESAVKSPSSPTISMPGTPPAYSATMTSAQTSQANFPPPPVYQRPGTYQIARGGQGIRPGGPQYAMATSQQQQLLLQQRKIIQQQQQQEKRRLLQQQQQQQLLIPSNAAAELNSGLQNIDSLLNNTVAPNVTLQRSSSVPDSQLSPGYGNSIMNVNNGNQTQRHNQQPYSPHSQMASPLSQQQYPQTTVNSFQQSGARVSPHPPFQQQLSPRQGYPPSQANTQTASWSQSQAANRLSLQQQQNPMLNAQLTGSYTGANRGFQVQRQQQQQQQSQQQQQRAIGSPGAANATRQSPYPAEAFPPPASPTSGFASQNQFQQQMRLQRTISAPSATTQLPGGLGSPRQFAGRGDHPPGTLHHQYPPPPHPPPPPPHPASLTSPHHQQQQQQQQPPQSLQQPTHHHQHQHPMMYQQDSQYCYDQTTLQLAFNGADRGRGPPPHLQGGGAGNGNGMNATSEYVRQELRAVVGARTGQAPSANVRAAAQLTGNQMSAADLESLGLTFEMPTSGASDSPKLWGAMGSDMGSMSPQPPPTLSSSSRTTTEEMARPGDQKSSLLQKLLSE